MTGGAAERTREMSRREGRDSHGRRLHSSSRSQRERERDDPSTKRARDDRRRETDRTHSSSRGTESAKIFYHEQKRRPLEDAAQHVDHSRAEIKSSSDTKNYPIAKLERSPRGTKRFSDSRETSRSQSYFQHDERGSAGQGGRHYDRQASDHGRHRDQKEHLGDRDKGKAEGHGLLKNAEQAQPHGGGDSVWRHDGFFQLEDEAPPAKRKPAFNEMKMSLEPESAAATAVTEPDSRSRKSEQPGPIYAKREERRNYRSRGFDKPEGLFGRTDDQSTRREFSDQRVVGQRNGYDSRGSFAGRGGRGRDRFNNPHGGRSTYQPAGGQVEKWKHDLYDQANRSPTPKNEEEQIAKVEALLSL